MELNINDNEYINIEDALKRTGGNRDLYKRLLKRFVEGNDIETLEAALARGDMEESSHLTHTLKGVSANLSLVGINAASISLEQAIKNGTSFSEHFNALKLVFEATLKIIAEITK
ncbi:MAG: Hpt domain-containing protein [Oscillospiraceae bacterium]|nr:Hpt domain-containing protein [Oscillospiraceae bacterium]